MGKTCTELFAGIDCTILGNADDEERYRLPQRPGATRDAFFCVVGMTTDGHRSPRTPSIGARKAVVERKVYWPTLRTSRRSGEGCKPWRPLRRILRPSSKDLALVGITGTNGKTTTTTW
ncbi:MAG: hypothetical protein ACLT98_14475 [Eggerthellaceae bacterium]